MVSLSWGDVVVVYIVLPFKPVLSWEIPAAGPGIPCADCPCSYCFNWVAYSAAGPVRWAALGHRCLQRVPLLEHRT